MDFELLNLIPYDLLNLIWKNVKPSVKYSINKYYFKKFYCVRFSFINNKKFLYNIYLTNYNHFIISNFNYLKYLIKNDCIMFYKTIINYRLNNKINFKNHDYILKNKFYFENKLFNNVIDFSLFYSTKFKSNKILIFIEELIKTLNLTNLQKKRHKNNNNKLNKWIV